MNDEAYDKLDDFELMKRIVAEDDRQAFSRLVVRYQNFLLNFFLRSGVQYDAEDLVQQTFLRIYRYRKQYKPVAKFTTFLFMIARQVWIDELRKRDRRRQLTEKLTNEPLRVQRDVPNPSSVVSKRIDLARALQTLPEGLRQVVELGVYQDLPYQEVSEILGIPVGTVKSRMFHALAKLRDVFGIEKKKRGGK